MEVIFGTHIHEDKLNRAVAESENRIDTSDVQFKMESKKRGVYVEKWASPKEIRVEDNKRQPRMKAKPAKFRPAVTQQLLLTSTPAESKIATFTKLLGTADPAIQFKKRKTHKKTPSTPKISKQNSKMSALIAKSQPKEIKPLRNIIEENKKNVKNTKFRSNALKQVYSNMSEKTISYKYRRDIVQTPSNCSKLTRDLSDHAHWSSIFPSDRQNTEGKNLLQQYICNYEQGGNTLNDIKPNADKKPTAAPQGKKQEPVYDFFIDLLESVYDEDLLNADEGTMETSPKTSNDKFEIDDNVAEKLYMLQQNSNRYTIKDEMYEPSNQNKQLADCYDNEKRLVPPKRRRRRKTINKGFPYLPPYAKDERKRRKNPNLLTILKEQLSMDYHQEQPDNMYEALLTIAQQNRKRRQIYIDTSSQEPSEPAGVCRFRRRKVISPSTRLPKKNLPRKEYSMNATRGKYRSDITDNDKDSSHSLEVLGYDYEEGASRLDMESDSDAAVKSYRNIMKLNEGITTVTQYWKS